MPCDDILAAVLLGTPLPANAATHVTGCARCRSEAPLVRAVAAALAADAVPPPAPALGVRVLAAAEPLLAVRRLHVPWALVLRALGVALLPLPLIVLVDVGLIGAAHRLLAHVLPAALTTYLIANLASTLALLLALTYAAVPLLAARQLRAHPEDAHA
jgi:hypothetical protein